MTQETRLNQVEKSLTPQQAVMRWLQEIQPLDNVWELVHFLRNHPEREAPLTQLTEQTERAVRGAIKDQPKPVVEAAVRRSVRDVVFLMKLHLQVNYELMLKIRTWRVSHIAIAESLRCLYLELTFRNIIVDIADQVNFETPFPLEPDISETVKAAIKNQVYTWESLEDEGILQDWLWDYLLEKGETALPRNAYHFPEGKYTPNITPKNEPEIRACFKEDSEFELFRSGKDYTHGLASLNDAEYYRHYGLLVSHLQGLIQSGQVKGGLAVSLETVPIQFLRQAPLIEGKWLDRQVIELAEWGALLLAQGYQVKTEDQPLLTTVKYIKPDGQEVGFTEMQALFQKAAANLSKFQGRTKLINNRPYCYFPHYRNWQGRKVQGELKDYVQPGILTSSWNQWLHSHKGENSAAVNQVPGNTLQCSVTEQDYYSCPQGLEGHLQQREQLLEQISGWQFKAEGSQEIVQEWQRTTESVLIELHAFQQAVIAIQNKYYEGYALLFPDLAAELADTITTMEQSVITFNERVANKIDSGERLDLDTIRNSAKKAATKVMAYIIDMGKVEALDNLGENEAARGLAEKYV